MAPVPLLRHLMLDQLLIEWISTRIFYEWPISTYLLAALMFELVPEYCMGNLAA